MRWIWLPLGMMLAVFWAGGAAAQCRPQCDNQCSGQYNNGCFSACMNACTAASPGYSAPVSPGRSYGAIATAVDGGDAYGFSYRWGTRGEAEREALQECDARAGRRGCRVAVWFYNSCGALAQGADGAWGADHGATPRQAAANAMRYCRANDSSGTCHIVRSYCTQ